MEESKSIYEQQPPLAFPGDIYEDGDYRKIAPRDQKVNTLLVRSQLGKVRATTYSLPGDTFVYGQQDQLVEAGAAGSVNSWQEHRGNAAEIPNRDFVRLNKYAAMNGVTTSKDVADFRCVNDIRQPPANTSAPSMAYFPPPETTYGRPSAKSIPIVKLLQNNYQREWIGEERQRKINELNTNSQPKTIKLQHTRASIGHTKVPAPEPKKMYKMKQFDNVPSRALALAGLNAMQSNEAPAAETNVAQTADV